MSVTAPAKITNRLVQLLPADEQHQLLLQCEVVDMQFGQILCEPGQPYPYLYFPLHGFVSLLAPLSGHIPLEMCLMGNEGMLGASLVLGIETAPMQAIVQGKGSAWRIRPEALQTLLEECVQLRRTLQQYLFLQFRQLSQSAACGHFHELPQRLARWYLMSDDRTQCDEFYLTHQFLAGMLGVRRSGVTVAAGKLQKQHLIRYNRGMVHILDHEALRQMSCECYGAGLDDYRNILGIPSTGALLRQSFSTNTP
ncbi:Crp/Fnr family transcriptional regulator [Lacimicrobium sp. SS2-24]|uniref:Crp/Fnr family transcriptional regulator n=1 Tax=Lacimicrobium sp. SS2-24 TaxID=2005569 RepID=UPI000B4AFB5D|nr:Crp/Fnr family transcriptional regulator [Lacimicrobium sp. SS2-24]